MDTLRPWAEHLAADARFVSSPSPTLPMAWRARWAAAPGAPLFRDVDGHWWTAEAFAHATETAARRLGAAGLVAGDRLLWSCPSSVAALAAHVGALRLGLVVVPVNPAYSLREVAHIVADVRPAAAVVDGPAVAAWLQERLPGPVVDPSLPLPDGPELALDGAGSDDAALIGFTSGTTGAPKGAVLSHGNLWAATEALRLAWRWTPEDRLIHALPVFHAHGLCVGVYGTLLAGASAELLPGFRPELVAERAQQRGATLFFGVPTMYHRLLASGRAGELARLRLCVSGSAPLPAALHEAMGAQLGHAVLERFGMTETLMNTSNPYEGERRAGTVGFPLPGVAVRLEDDEILVRGPNVFGGYWERPEANRESFVEADDGGAPWFRTGDLGAFEDGYLVIRGRSKELIISGGYNVYPAEVEDVLLTFPGVAEVAVTGTPSDEWGEVVTAWIVADGTRAPSLEALAAHAAASLAPYKVPRRLEVVEALPRNALGKLVRGALTP